MYCFAQRFQPLCSLLIYLHLTLVALVCLGPRIALLIVDLSPSQSFMLCAAQHFQLLCLISTCLCQHLPSFVLLNTPRPLLVVELPLSQSLLLWFAQHLESLCSLLTCLDCFNLSCFVLNTSSRSTRCSVVSSGYLNCFRTGSCKFLSPSSADRISFCSCFIHPIAFEYFDLFLIALSSVSV